MIENKDIIVIGIQPWDIPIGSNCKDIAKQFSKENRVLYVNNPISYIDFFNKYAYKINAFNSIDSANSWLNRI